VRRKKEKKERKGKREVTEVKRGIRKEKQKGK